MKQSKLIFIVLLLCCLLFLSACHVHWGGQTKQDRATDKNKPSICLDASAPDVCLRGVALANNNPDACRLMSDEYSTQSCLALLDYDDTKDDGDDSLSGDGDCTYDSDCPAICEGDILWKMGCNPRTGDCEKTFDTDCSATVDTLAGFDFPQTCMNGVCVRNEADIAAVRSELTALQQDISANVKGLIAYRQEVNAQKLDANAKCLNALADVTNMFIIDSALRLGSVINSGITYVAKGSSLVTSTTTLTYQNNELVGITKISTNFNFGNDVAGAMGDYAGQVTEKMYAITAAEQAGTKPPVEDYIAFYCHYNEYLGEVLDVTGAQLDQQVAMAQVLESQINALN
jgi:hypothetical protein